MLGLVLRDSSFAQQFFNALRADGTPVWTRNIEERGAVFSFPGHCYRSGIS